MLCLPVSQLFNKFSNKNKRSASSEPSESFVFGLLSSDWTSSSRPSSSMNNSRSGFSTINGQLTSRYSDAQALRLWDNYLIQFPHKPFELDRVLCPPSTPDHRVLKHYLLIRDQSTKTKRLAVMQELDAKTTPNFARAAGELLHELRHAYLLPILSLDIFVSHASHALAVLPFCGEGTLHQLIAKLKGDVDQLIPATPTATMVRSSFMSTSMVSPVSPSLINIFCIHEVTVKKFARQILEALVFLHCKGFRPYGHFTSSDVIIQNGVARLVGVENVLIRSNGHRRSCLLTPDEDFLINCDSVAIDTLSFGHLFWELVDGHRLETPKPGVSQLVNYQRWPPLYNAFKKIFAMEHSPTANGCKPSNQSANLDNNNGSVIKSSNTIGFPQIEEIMTYAIFAVDLREMPGLYTRAYYNCDQDNYSMEAKELIKEIGLQVGPDPRLASRSSFDIYFTPPQTPGQEKKTIGGNCDYDDGDWPDAFSAPSRKKAASMTDRRGHKTQTNMFNSDIRLFTKFRKFNSEAH